MIKLFIQLGKPVYLVCLVTNKISQWRYFSFVKKKKKKKYKKNYMVHL